MDRKSLVLLGLGLIIIAAAIGAGCTNAPATNGTHAQTTAHTQETLRAPAPLAAADALKAVAPGIQAELDRLDRATATAATALASTGMTGNETRRVLGRLALASPAVIDASAVSRDGIMLTVEPAGYASAEGADISDQEQIQRLRSTQQPVMSGVFETVEGVNATDLEHPVIAPSGQFNGSASLLFNPTVLLTIAVQEALAGRSAEVFVMDTDGLMLYDRDAAEVGKYTLSDPMYATNPELLAVAKRMQSEPGGTGSYTFAAEGSSTPVRKEVAWTSVGLYGTDWRVVAVNATLSA
jgi:branched-chain amino acid transport system substrate-binding protein